MGRTSDVAIKISHGLLDKVNESIGEVFDEIENEDVAEAIRNAINLDDVVKELISDDPGVKKALRDKVREVLISDIENISDPDELDQYLKDDWDDLIPGIFEAKDIIEGLCKEDIKVQKEIRTKIKEMVLYELDDEGIPADIIKKDYAKERIKELSVDPDFMREIQNALDSSIRTVLLNSIKHNDLATDLIENNEQIKEWLKIKIEEMTHDIDFLRKMEKMVLTYINTALNSADFAKTLMTQILSNVVQDMFTTLRTRNG